MTIGEMARRTGLTESTLRYYEKKGLIRVARDGGGRRDYDEGDVAWVAFLCRLKDTGMLNAVATAREVFTTREGDRRYQNF